LSWIFCSTYSRTLFQTSGKVPLVAFANVELASVEVPVAMPFELLALPISSINSRKDSE
jgi:hypothetical protein